MSELDTFLRRENNRFVSPLAYWLRHSADCEDALSFHCQGVERWRHRTTTTPPSTKRSSSLIYRYILGIRGLKPPVGDVQSALLTSLYTDNGQKIAGKGPFRRTVD